MPPTPLPVANDVQPGLFLQPDGERHHIVHGGGEFVCRQLLGGLQQVLHRLRPWQRADHLSREWRQPSGPMGLHGLPHVSMTR